MVKTYQRPFNIGLCRSLDFCITFIPCGLAKPPPRAGSSGSSRIVHSSQTQLINSLQILFTGTPIHVFVNVSILFGVFLVVRIQGSGMLRPWSAKLKMPNNILAHFICESIELPVIQSSGFDSFAINLLLFAMVLLSTRSSEAL